MEHNNSSSDRDFSRIPRVVVKRLFKYHSALEKHLEEGLTSISSHHLSEHVQVKASQLRKDLAYCGEFGTRGKGYDVGYLHGKLSEILGLQTTWPTIFAGLGRLGNALIGYEGIKKRGFIIKAVFEIDEAKIGKVVHGIKVYGLEDMPKIVKEHNVQIGVITVPTEAAQLVCDTMVDSGIKAILNFAPALLNPKKPVFVERVDISRELVTLSHYLTYHQ